MVHLSLFLSKSINSLKVLHQKQTKCPDSKSLTMSLIITPVAFWNYFSLSQSMYKTFAFTFSCSLVFNTCFVVQAIRHSHASIANWELLDSCKWKKTAQLLIHPKNRIHDVATVRSKGLRWTVTGCVFKSYTEYNAVMEEFRPVAARAIFVHTYVYGSALDPSGPKAFPHSLSAFYSTT